MRQLFLSPTNFILIRLETSALTKSFSALTKSSSLFASFLFAVASLSCKLRRFAAPPEIAFATFYHLLPHKESSSALRSATLLLRYFYLLCFCDSIFKEVNWFFPKLRGFILYGPLNALSLSFFATKSLCRSNFSLNTLPSPLSNQRFLSVARSTILFKYAFPSVFFDKFRRIIVSVKTQVSSPLRLLLPNRQFVF